MNKLEQEVNGPGIIWEGKGLDEVGRRADTNEIVIKMIQDILDLLKLTSYWGILKKLMRNLDGFQK